MYPSGIPENVVAVITPTTMFGEPVSPCAFVAVVAVPVKLPSKVVAVATPVTLTPFGNRGEPVPALFVYWSALTLDLPENF